MQRIIFPLFVLLCGAAVLPALFGGPKSEAGAAESIDLAVPAERLAAFGSTLSGGEGLTEAPAVLPTLFRANEGRLEANARLYAGQPEIEAIFYPTRFLLVAKGFDARSAVLRFSLDGASPTTTVNGTLPRSVSSIRGTEEVYGGVRFREPWAGFSLSLTFDEDEIAFHSTASNRPEGESQSLTIKGTRGIEQLDDGVALVTNVGRVQLVGKGSLNLVRVDDETVELVRAPAEVAIGD